MTSLEILTPSYAPDRELCGDLNESVLRLASPDVRHRLVVPARDLALFADLAGERTEVVDARRFLPRTFRPIPRVNGWLDLRAPYPPVRGWIAQQIVKLAAAAESPADVVVIADSDLTFVRPFGVADFAPDGSVPLYRLDGAVTELLPRHLLWHRVARRLLGLPATDERVLPDYICWPCAWSPSVVRTMLDRIHAVTGMHWASAIGRQLHFSEMILYGVYVDEVLSVGGPVRHTSAMPCRVHPDEIRMDEPGLRTFLSGVGQGDLAIMVSAKSGTDLGLRRRLVTDFAAQLADSGS
jgi:hypothetical protein